MAKLYILSKAQMESGQNHRTPRERPSEMRKNAQEVENDKLRQELKSIKDYVSTREDYLQGEIIQLHANRSWWKSTCVVLSSVIILENLALLLFLVFRG